MIIIDSRDKRPIYEQIVEKMSDLMAMGALEADEKLPSVRILATDLSINPNTIQRAYLELERQGYIYSIKGKGSFVSDIQSIKQAKQRKIYEELTILIKKAKALDMRYEDICQKIEHEMKGVQE